MTIKRVSRTSRKPAEGLEKAIKLAIEKHAGQVDKSGAPFIGHPIRVMASLRPDELAMTVGVLHDIIEDTDVEMYDLESWFGPVVARAVLFLTKTKHETYRQYINSIKVVGGLARRVKLADLRDNMRPDRIVTKEIESLQKRYRWAVSVLNGLESKDAAPDGSDETINRSEEYDYSLFPRPEQAE